MVVGTWQRNSFGQNSVKVVPVLNVIELEKGQDRNNDGEGGGVGSESDGGGNHLQGKENGQPFLGLF